MSEFDSEDAYRDFARTVRGQRRWILEGRAAKFLDSVRKACRSREHVLKTGSKLWRCQRGSTLGTETDGEGEDEHIIEVECPHPSQRMIPDSQFAKGGGRANPSGLVYLYLASSPETAMAEMRPWVGESLSVALFEIQCDVRVILCQAEVEDPFERIPLYGQSSSSENADKYVWSDISEAFARPVNRNDSESAYVPTQILAEAFGAEGFGGVAYRSGLSKGINLVLFDIHIAKPVRTYLYALKSANYTFVADDPRFAIHTQTDGVFEYLLKLTSESP